MRDAARLILRGVTGTLMAGHGAQKLFGWFEGPGLSGTTAMLSSMRFRSADRWALLAAGSEFGGGVLTALGFLDPLGPMGIAAAMGMAGTTAHWGKPIWTTKGGAELPLTNATIATALALVGPGRYSLDHVLGIKPPRWVLIPAALLTIGGVAAGHMFGREHAQPEQAVPPTAEHAAAMQPAATQPSAQESPMPLPSESPAAVAAQPVHAPDQPAESAWVSGANGAAMPAPAASQPNDGGH